MRHRSPGRLSCKQRFPRTKSRVLHRGRLLPRCATNGAGESWVPPFARSPQPLPTAGGGWHEAGHARDGVRPRWDRGGGRCLFTQSARPSPPTAARRAGDEVKGTHNCGSGECAYLRKGWGSAPAREPTQPRLSLPAPLVARSVSGAAYWGLGKLRRGGSARKGGCLQHKPTRFTREENDRGSGGAERGPGPHKARNPT